MEWKDLRDDVGIDHPTGNEPIVMSTCIPLGMEGKGGISVNRTENEWRYIIRIQAKDFDMNAWSSFDTIEQTKVEAEKTYLKLKSLLEVKPVETETPPKTGWYGGKQNEQ